VPVSALSGPAPIDAMKVYLTSTNVIGQPLSDAELGQQLRLATDEHFVIEAATWLAHLEHHGSLDVDFQLEAAAKMFVEPALTKVQNLIRSGYRLLAPQVLLAVIKAALLASPPGAPAQVYSNGPNPFTFAMLGVADQLGIQPEESGELWGSYPADISLEVARNQSFNVDHVGPEHEVPVAELPGAHRVAADGVHVHVDGQQVVAALGVVLQHLVEEVAGGQPLALEAALHVGDREQHRVDAPGVDLGPQLLDRQCPWHESPLTDRPVSSEWVHAAQTGGDSPARDLVRS
jgi:hypothetical protein